MRLYLETSSLRFLGRRIINIPNVFTSFLSLFELISGLTDEDFSQRKSIIRYVLDSKMPIDWDSPEALYASAFPVFPVISQEELRTNSMRSIFEMILSSSNSREVKEKSRHLEFDLEYFQKYDSIYSTRFLIAGEKGIQETKQIASIDPAQKNILDNLNTSLWNFNYASTLYAIAKGCASAIGDDNGNKEDIIKDIYNSYNGKIDFYVAAFSYYSANQLSLSQFSGKNDAFDIMHFLYLRNDPTVVIVSNDRLISKISMKIFQNNFKTPDEII